MRAEADFEQRAERIRKRARRTIAIAYACLGLMIVLTVGSAYSGRNALVQSQRAGCARSTLDRLDIAAFIRDAQAARLKVGDVEIARGYAKRAVRMERRAGVPPGSSEKAIAAICEHRFPQPSIFGF